MLEGFFFFYLLLYNLEW